MRDAFSGYSLTVPKPTHDYTKEIIEQSREKYARPRAEVEQEMKAWDESTIGNPENPTTVAKNELEDDFDEPMI